MIPNIIHFIFGLKPDFGGKPFSYFHYLAVKSAAVVNRPDAIIMHYAHEPAGEWWEAARPFITLNRVTPPETVNGHRLAHYAHKADALRMQILTREGGAYLDLDTFCINSFEPLRGHDAVMGVEPGTGLCNAVMLCAPGSAFMQRWLDSFGDFDNAHWNFHAVQLPYQVAEKLPDAVRILDEYAFFFPSHTDPMHEWLWRGDVSPLRRARAGARSLKFLARAIKGESKLKRSTEWRHAFLSKEWFYARLQQSYCMHLWESLWWAPYLRDMTPQTLAQSEGLFAKLVRKTLPDELNGA